MTTDKKSSLAEVENKMKAWFTAPCDTNLNDATDASKRFRKRKFQGAKVPGSEKFYGAKAPESELAKVLLKASLQGANWPVSE